MPQPIDHVVLPCPDLAAAAALFAQLGFQVGGRNRHPWGTENHIIQFPGAFLELIALAPGYEPLRPDAEAFPFAGFLAGQAASSAPSGMVVLRSDDAEADGQRFAAAGIGARRMLRFSRDTQGPDGATRTVAFTLAFAAAPTMPDLGFFVCEQHRPENFWNSAFQRHPNGVTGLSGLVIIAETPADHVGFLEAFTGTRAQRTISDVSLDTGGGTIDVLTPQAYQARFGGIPQEYASPGLAALRFATRADGAASGVRKAGSTGPALVFEPTATLPSLPVKR